MVKREEVVTEIKTVTKKIIPKKVSRHSAYPKKSGAKKKKVVKHLKAHSQKKKKRAKKPVVKTKIIVKKNTNTLRDVKTEKILVENFISLQRIMTDMSGKFGELTTKISALLELFENSAKTLVKRDFEVERSEKPSEEFLARMDKMLEQNRTIAKGLVLMNDHSDKLHEHATKVQGDYAPSMLPSQVKAPAPSRRKIEEIKAPMPIVKESIKDKGPEIPKGF